MISSQSRQSVCKAHGGFESKALVLMGKVVNWTSCPKCEAIKSTQNDEAEIQKKKRESESLINQQLKRSGVPSRFRDKTFDGYKADTKEQGRALKICQYYANNFGRFLSSGTCLALIGKTGTGKNHLAMAIANHLVKNRHTVVVEDVYMMLSDIKHAQNNRDEKETSLIRKYSLPDLLIIDEIGSQVGSESDKRILNKVINERYSETRPTILMSNLDVQSFKQFLGDRIVDRFREGGGKIIPFTWESYRSKVGSDLWEI